MYLPNKLAYLKWNPILHITCAAKPVWMLLSSETCGYILVFVYIFCIALKTIQWPQTFLDIFTTLEMFDNQIIVKGFEWKQCLFLHF